MQLVDALGPGEVSESYLAALANSSALSASLVCSPSGDFQDSEGSSKSLGGPIDKIWLRALRSQTEVVLTSGETFRAEQYRMPARADLAVLTKSGVDSSSLKFNPGQVLRILNSDSYRSAISDLQGVGYGRIHIEFGPRGISELLRSNVAFDLWLSGSNLHSVTMGAKNLGVSAVEICQVAGLTIALAR